jgi:hypothetical protein
LSGPIIVFGAGVVVVVFVPLDWSCAATFVCGAEAVFVEGVVVDWVEFVVFVAGAGVVELPLFFAFAAGVVCAPAIDPAIRNALIQKLAANFKYLFIGILFPKQVSTSITPSVHPPLCAASIQLPRHRPPAVAALRLL